MLSFNIEDQRFQVRSAAVVRHDDHLLLHRAEGDSSWALPGGRVELGEDAASTLMREFQEELAIELSCGSLLYVIENFFEYGGKPYHELGLYFAASLPSDSVLLAKDRSHPGVENSQTLEFKWFPFEAIESIDLRPSFLKATIAHPQNGIQHIVQRTSTL